MLWKSETKCEKETKYEKKQIGKTTDSTRAYFRILGERGGDEPLGHWNSTYYLGQNRREQQPPPYPSRMKPR